MADFKLAYQAKRKLIEREREDFLFAMGEQWTAKEKDDLKAAGIKPVVDNRIQPNLFLLVGLERQNRSEFKAFPQGEEDGIRSEIASLLFKDSIKRSGFLYKTSEQFKDGITCGESHLELYLNYDNSLTNGTPYWRKCDGNMIFPDPSSKEYDFCDARYVYKLMLDVSRDDLINLYPEKKKVLTEARNGKLNLDGMSNEGTHLQKKDYPTRTESDEKEKEDEECFDLLERYHKVYMEHVFIGDKKTGEIKEVENREQANSFIQEYQNKIYQDLEAFQMAKDQATQNAAPGQVVELPPAPPEQDVERFIVIERMVPEIWCFAHVPGILEPLAYERAWFYPKWKLYPFIPYFARFSNAPIYGDDRHLLIQGLVHGVKGAQEKHNKAEVLMLRHLNSATNSGWLSEEEAWTDPDAVRNFGSSPGINLTYKQGRQKPERIFPMPLSTGHAQISLDSAESIKAQLGINADLLAASESSGDSGRAIALRQKQGLLMVQELFDNLSRTRQIAGKFLLSQLGEIYDTEVAIKVLGEGFMMKNFPPPLILNPETGQQEPISDKAGQPMTYDKEMAELAIAEVLSGDLGEYDVTVGDSVASETQRMAVANDLAEIAKAYPGLIPPTVIVKHSQLPEATKNDIMTSIQQAQAAAQQQQQQQAAQPGKETQ